MTLPVRMPTYRSSSSRSGSRQLDHRDCTCRSWGDQIRTAGPWQDRRLLNNKNRRAIIDYIGKHPGCTVTDISFNTRINRGTVKYHLFLLLRERKIVRKNDGNKIYHFKNSGICLEKKQVFGYIQNPRKRQILAAIQNDPASAIPLLQSGCISTKVPFTGICASSWTKRWLKATGTGKTWVIPSVRMWR